MALTLKTTKTEVVLTRERTYQVLVHNRQGEIPRIEARREQIVMKGEEVKEWLTNALVVRRDFPKVSNETIEIVGRTGDPITVGQLWATIANLIDRWAIEDRPALAAEVTAAEAAMAEEAKL